MSNQTKIIDFDFNQFEKIEDIIYLDEPILTHLTKNGKHFLNYLVDTIDSKDIYLLIEIEESEIFDYLTANLSLKKLIQSNQNYILRIEQDFNGVINSVEITKSESIIPEYLPSEDSFLIYEPSSQSYYYNFIKEYQAKAYLRSLRERAFYIKLAPTNSKYSDTIGFNELVSELLKNISSSYKSFLKADFFESFKEKVTDVKKLVSVFKRIEDDLDFRTVDFNFGSFEIGLAVDHIMKQSIEDSDIRSWAIDVGTKYRTIVLDDDYNEENVEAIILNYSPEDRKKIFEPIFKITENKNFDFKIKTSKNSNYSKIRITDKTKIDRIIPIQTSLPEVEKPKEFEIFQLTSIKEKGVDKKTFRIGENTLFDSTDTKTHILKNKDFEKYDYKLDQEIEITLNMSTSKGQIILEAQYDSNDFTISVDVSKFEDGVKQMIASIYEYIL